MLSYLILITISLVSLFTIDFWPLYQIIFAKSNLDLAGLSYLVLSWVLWIAGFFISVGLFIVLQWLLRLPKIPWVKLISTAFVINIIGTFSVYPGLQIGLAARDIWATTGFKVEVRLLEDALEERQNPDGMSAYYYKYKIEVDNKSGRTFTNVPVHVGIIQKSSILDVTQVGHIITTRLPKGKILLTDTLLLSLHSTSKEKKYPVKITIRFNITGTKYITRYLTPKVPRLDDFVYSHAQ